MVVVPYPVSGISRDAVVQKARDAGSDVARELARKLTELPEEPGTMP